jgi:integrase
MRKPYYLHKREAVWYVQFSLPGGKISPAKSSGETNKTRAEDWARNTLPTIGRPDTTLAEWAAPFFGDRCPHVTRLRTEGRSYGEEHRKHSGKLLAAHILPDPICRKKLADIKKADILEFRERLVRNNGACRTSQIVMATLHVIMREALFRELIEKDLFLGIGLIHYNKRKRPALPDAVMSQVLDASRYADPLHYEMTCCAAYTGMRAGEILALSWGVIGGGRIHIMQSIPVNTTTLKDPKWGKKRFCPYPDSLSAIIEPRRGDPEEFVFQYRDSHKGYQKWATALKKAAPSASLHLLRHTLNTRLLEAGVPREIVRGWLGWSSAEAQEYYTDRDAYDYAAYGGNVDAIMGKIRLIGGNNEST